MTDSIPEKLGKYKIIEEVGRGGFAAVYKAVDTTLDRTVALKVLAPHLLWDPTFVQRFQREAKVAANLDHANIVTIYEVGHIEGVYFIAMQFLEGRTLSQILEAEGPLPVSRVQAVIEQIASALDYAHARDFVHRDIKPSNVIVANDGRATLTDFGLVKAGEGTKLSTTGVVFGTPEYMSPEQAEGKVLDARSDIYSLGVVVYEMLAGQAPFVADTTPAVMYKHVHEPPPLEELPSDLPPSVMTVVERALAKKREERYQSAGEMAVALQQAASGAVIEEVKPAPPIEPSPRERPRPEPELVPVPPPAEPARPALPWKWVAGGGAVVVVVAALIFALAGRGKQPIVTPVPPTATQIARATTPAPTVTPIAISIPPTDTPVPLTPVPPTDTPTSGLPTDTPTFTSTPIKTPTPVPPTNTPTSTPTSTPTPTSIIEFTVDDDSIDKGACTTLRVHIENVQAAYLSGAEYSDSPVAGPRWSGSTCPTSDTGYTLRVVKLDGSTDPRTITVTVTVSDTKGPDISDLKTSEPYLLDACDCSPCEMEVYVNVTDPGGVAKVELFYKRPKETTWQIEPMTNIGGTSYRTTLNSDTWNWGTLEFYVLAYDNRGNPSESLHLTMDVKACVI